VTRQATTKPSSDTPMQEEASKDSAGGRSVVFFCIRADSDADHLVPVIDAYRRRHTTDLRVVIYDGIKSYEDDYRFDYLRQKHGVAAEHIFDLPGQPAGRGRRLRALRSAFTALVKLQRRFAGRLVENLTRRPLHFLQEHLGRAARDAASAAALIKEIRAYGSGVIIFDHTMNPLAQAVSGAVRGKGFALAALPHSIPHVSSLLRDPASGKAQAKGKTWSDVYDVLAVPNEASAQRLSADGAASDVFAILGSPRFGREWSDTLDHIAPAFDWKVDRPKVLFVLSKHGPYVDWDGVNQVVGELSRGGRMAVAIKPHTRTEINGLPDAGESAFLRVIGPEIPTCSLIRWADLVLFWGTSVVYDALRLNKPTLHLSYLIRLNFDFESYISDWRVSSLEELRGRLDAFLTAPAATYSEAEAITCLAALSGEESHTTVAARYSDLIESLLADAARLDEPSAGRSAVPGAVSR